MINYGNKYRILTGIIRYIQDSMVKVEFESEKQDNTVNVPKNIIHSEIEYKKGIPQTFKIPTWFLKRNRIIPLNENISSNFNN